MGSRGIIVGVWIGGMAACLAAEPPVVRARYLMGTRCTATAYGDAASSARLLRESLDAIAGLEARISTWDEGSELSRANRAAGAGATAIRPDLAALLDRSLALARATGGAFDPTVGALVAAWDLRGKGRIPDPEALARAREAVGYDKVRLDPVSGALEYAAPGLWMELGGIGKGLALERAAALLRGPEVSAALLDFGGQVLALGAPPGEDSWRIAVAHPEDRERTVLVLGLRDRSAATSSQSERGLLVGGRHVGHILDPRTGVPVPRAGSVTVVARSAAEADALATALFVMGPDRGLAWAEGRELGVGFLEPVAAGEGGARLRLRANRRFSSHIIARRDLVETAAPGGIE